MCAVPYRCRWSIGKRNQIGLAWESDGSFDGLMVWGGGGGGGRNVPWVPASSRIKRVN